jgi:PAS domain S-box-containing protein
MAERRKSEKARLESLLRIRQYDAASTQELLEFALSEAINLSQSDIGYIYFYDEKTRKFTLNTWSKEVMEVCTIQEPQIVYDLDKTGIWGEAVRQAKPIIVNDFNAPNPLKKGYPEGHAPLFRFMTIPVFSQGRIVSVLGLANKKTDYIQADVQQITLLMNSIWQMAERKRFEDELKRSEERYRTILDTITEGYFEHDLAGIFYFANQSACKMLGCSMEQLIGQSYKRFVSEETAQNMFSVYNRIYLTGKPETLMDFEILPLTGGRLQIELNVTLIVDEKGTPTGYRVMGRNVTERHEAEEALRKDVGVNLLE